MRTTFSASTCVACLYGESPDTPRDLEIPKSLTPLDSATLLRRISPAEIGVIRQTDFVQEELFEICKQLLLIQSTRGPDSSIKQFPTVLPL